MRQRALGPGSAVGAALAFPRLAEAADVRGDEQRAQRAGEAQALAGGERHGDDVEEGDEGEEGEGDGPPAAGDICRGVVFEIVPAELSMNIRMGGEESLARTFS